MESQPHRIITIGRQYGSGGREIGRRTAARLGFSFYDSELLTLAAKRAGWTRRSPPRRRSAPRTACSTTRRSASAPRAARRPAWCKRP